MSKIVIQITEPKTKEEMVKLMEEHLKEEKNKKDIDIIVSAKPNYINKQILKVLKTYNIAIIELEIKSTNDYILKRLGEEYTFKDIKKISKMIKWNRFKLGYQIVVGLPESTRIDEINTGKSIIKMKPKMVNITPLLVMKNSELEKEYKQKKYKPLTIVQAVEACKELVELFNTTKIETIGIGYGVFDDNLEQLKIAEQVVDGPFHPSFRQLVETALWYDAIVNKIKQLNVKVMQVEVTVNLVDVNNVIGYKQDNLKKLKDLYDVDLIVTANDNIKPGKSKIDILKIYQDFKD